MTFIEKASAKRAAYIAAGYTCTDLESTESSAKFSASDQYGVTREHIFGELPKTTPILEQIKAKAPKVDVPVDPQPQPEPPAKKPRKKKGE